MNITHESTGELTATLRIDISEEDYSEKVLKILKDYQRKANMPGFRPGKVPFGMIRKMYGKAVLADEINKLLSDSITGYFKDKQLETLGNPIASKNNNNSPDFDNDKAFNFFFDIGLAPTLDFKLSRATVVDHYTIRVDDEIINKYMEDIRKRFGTPVTPENTGETTGELKKEPEITPAEISPELFEKVYPGMKIETEEAFHEQIRKEVAANFAIESDKLFYREVTDKLVKEITVPLPDEFLKRWLEENKESKFSADDIEKQYPSFAESMRWQMIENKILRDNKIEVTDEDIRNYIKNYFFGRLSLSSDDPETAKRYDALVDTVMKNKDQVRRINDELYTSRLLELFRSSVGIEEKEVSYEDFIKLMSEKHIHDHGHVHDHDDDPEHDHDHDDAHHHDPEHDPMAGPEHKHDQI